MFCRARSAVFIANVKERGLQKTHVRKENVSLFQVA